MHRLNRVFAPCAAFGAALTLTSVASAGLVTEPLGVTTTPVSLDIEVDGTTLTVTAAGGIALTHNDPTNCSGAGTSTVVCTMVGDSIVGGKAGNDSFSIAMDAAANPHRLTVLGRKGDDSFEVTQADGGDLVIEGGQDTNSYALGSAGTPLPIAGAQQVRIYGGNISSGTGETYGLHVDVSGWLYVQATGGADTFDLSGRVEAFDGYNAGIDVRGRGGADTFYMDVDELVNSSTGPYNTVGNFDGGDGPDYFELATDVWVEGGGFTLAAGNGDDEFDLQGYAFTSVDAEVPLPGGGNKHHDASVVADGGAGTDSLIGDTGEHDPITGTISFTSW